MALRLSDRENADRRANSTRAAIARSGMSLGHRRRQAACRWIGTYAKPADREEKPANSTNYTYINAGLCVESTIRCSGRPPLPFMVATDNLS